MIPRSGEYLSLLMGAPSLSEAALRGAGVEVRERYGENLLGLLVPSDSVPAYKRARTGPDGMGFHQDENAQFHYRLRT